MQGDHSFSPSTSGSHHWSQNNRHVPSPKNQKGIHTDFAMINNNDAQLLDSFRAGDEAAFAILAERYRQAITAACERQAPHGEIDDCVQAVFVVLARRPAAAARAPVLLAWLHRVAHFVCRDAWRAATRRKQMITVAAQPIPAGNPPEAAVLEQLDVALLHLEERQRAAVLLHASGNANDDIAKSLGVTSANASKLVQRGLLGLRDYLYRRGTPISATVLLTLITTQHASATTAVPLTISALSSASLQVTSLAKGTLMHLTVTATSTWVIAASLAATVFFGGIVAAETLTPPPTPSGDQKATPVPSPIISAPKNDLSDTLSQRLTFEFKDASATDVLNWLRQITYLNIIIHPKASNAIKSTPITFKAKEISVQSALNLITKMLNVRYVEVDQALFITRLPEDDNGLFEKTEELLAESNVVGDAGDTKWGQEILAKLDARVNLDFQDTDFIDILSFLNRITNINVAHDPKIILTETELITMNVNDMKLRYVVNHFMRVTNLRYQIRDEVLFITTQTGEKNRK